MPGEEEDNQTGRIVLSGGPALASSVSAAGPLLPKTLTLGYLACRDAGLPDSLLLRVEWSGAVAAVGRFDRGSRGQKRCTKPEDALASWAGALPAKVQRVSRPLPAGSFAVVRACVVVVLRPPP